MSRQCLLSHLLFQTTQYQTQSKLKFNSNFNPNLSSTSTEKFQIFPDPKLSSTLNEFNFKLIHLQLSLIKIFDLGYHHRDEAQGLSIVCGIPLLRASNKF